MDFLLIAFLLCTLVHAIYGQSDLHGKGHVENAHKYVIRSPSLRRQIQQVDPINKPEADPWLTVSCQSRLSFQIERCLQKFEAIYLVYTHEDTTVSLQEAMEPMLCREYEETLQCLHLALRECPPAEFHLHMMGARLGHVRDFMTQTCERVKSSSTRAGSSTTMAVRSDAVTLSGPTSTTETPTVKSTEDRNSNHETNGIAEIKEDTQSMYQETNSIYSVKGKPFQPLPKRATKHFVDKSKIDMTMKKSRKKENSVLDKVIKYEGWKSDAKTAQFQKQVHIKEQNDCDGEGVYNNLKCLRDMYANSGENICSKDMIIVFSLILSILTSFNACI